MRGVRHLVLTSLVILIIGSAILSRASAQTVSVTALLDRYIGGDFDAVVNGLDEQTDYKRLLKDLQRNGDAWMAAGGAGERPRRELAAATFALEAARAGEWYEWKWLQSQSDGPLPVIYWQAPPLLIEWGCELLRLTETPRPIERVWQLAALAVSQRSEDPQFQIGNTEVDAGDRVAATQSATPTSSVQPPNVLAPRTVQMQMTSHPDEVLNVQHEIKHLMHVMDRFPAEKRFMLAQGVARERDTPADSIAIYSALADDLVVGAEARVRLGRLFMGQNRIPDALVHFDRVERMTRDSYVLYLARLFRGRAFLRLKQEENAMTALRGAVAVRPGMQSASVLLAELLIKNDLRGEAQTVMAAVLERGAGSYEPFLEYVHADDRFWSQLIAMLRAEIRR